MGEIRSLVTIVLAIRLVATAAPGIAAAGSEPADDGSGGDADDDSSSSGDLGSNYSGGGIGGCEPAFLGGNSNGNTC